MESLYVRWLYVFLYLQSCSVFCDIVTHTLRGRFPLTSDPTTIDGETIREVQRFRGVSPEADHFKTLMIEGSSMVIGARNVVYNVSLEDLQEQWRINWSPSDVHINSCLLENQQSEEECQNYIRVIAKMSENQLLICGTNAYNPYCRVYHVREHEEPFGPLADKLGNGRCPYDPKQNNTALYIGQRLYSATTADRQSRDALIFGSPMDSPGDNPQLPPTLRTQQYDSQWLNEPNHVHGFDYRDKVYFLFSEEAVEYINCGKKVFSRVGQVCKNDQGGKWVLKNTWSSFFKARLNCSIPGDFPFYFDEIQSASDIGGGNYMSTISPLDDRTDMFYAVFSTPENSIHGSAVCAFRMSDVLSVFEGPFKEQKQPNSNWLPVGDMDTPHPHPAKTCSNDSTNISDQTLNFIKTHPLMDGVVPSFGGRPVFTQASNSFRLTKIAVDWQVHAADKRYYDVIYIGTDDGRVIKTINRGISSVETVVIEDIEVFHDKSPVVNIKVYRNQLRGEAKLVVVSANEVKTIPLQRCHLQYTCSDCVGLQDPYCSWHQDRCLYSRAGKQSINTGKHHECPEPTTNPTVVETTPGVTCPPCPTCSVATSGDGDKNQFPATPKPNLNDTQMLNTPYEGPSPTEISNEIPVFSESKTDPERSCMDKMYSSGDMAVAVVVSILLSLIIGFFLGVAAMIIRARRVKQREPRDYCDTKPSGVGGENNKNQNDYHGIGGMEVGVDSLKKHRNDDHRNLNPDSCYHDVPNYAPVQPSIQPTAPLHPLSTNTPTHPGTPNLRSLPQEKPNNIGIVNNLRQTPNKTVNEHPSDANNKWPLPSMQRTNSKGYFI